MQRLCFLCDTWGDLQHFIAVAETEANLKQHIQNYAQQNGVEYWVAFKNVPRGAKVSSKEASLSHFLRN